MINLLLVLLSTFRCYCNADGDDDDFYYNYNINYSNNYYRSCYFYFCRCCCFYKNDVSAEGFRRERLYDRLVSIIVMARYFPFVESAPRVYRPSVVRDVFSSYFSYPVLESRMPAIISSAPTLRACARQTTQRRTVFPVTKRCRFRRVAASASNFAGARSFFYWLFFVHLGHYSLSPARRRTGTEEVDATWLPDWRTYGPTRQENGLSY